MAKQHWLKLYIELLDDPKIAKVPDWLFRRMILLFLVAKEDDQKGKLQPVADVAWRIRLAEDQVTETLQALSEIGVAHQDEQGEWRITNFAKRQAPSPVAQRVALHRQRATMLQSNESNVTCNVSTKSPEAEEDTESDAEEEDAPADDFDEMRFMIESFTGYLSMPGDVPAIQEMVSLGVIEGDIQSAVEFFRDKGKVARGAAHLLNSVKHARGKRIQARVQAVDDLAARGFTVRGLEAAREAARHG